MSPIELSLVTCGQPSKYITSKAADITAVVWLLFDRIQTHFSDDFGEHFVDIEFTFGRSLHEWRRPELSQSNALSGSHFSLVLDIHFVAHQKDRHPFCAFHSDDLFFHVLDVLESLMTGDRVDHYKALTVLYVEVAHRRELFSAGRVQDFEDARPAIHFDLLAVEVFDGWVVLFHECVGHELDGERAFADPSRAQYHHFVLAHHRRRRADSCGQLWTTLGTKDEPKRRLM